MATKKSKHAKVSLDTVRLGEHLRRKAKREGGSCNVETPDPRHCDECAPYPPENDEEPDSRPDR